MLIKSRFLDACILGFIVLSTYNPTLGVVKSDAVKEPVTYTKAGDAVLMEQETSISVSV